jgi:hypothetical protein
MTLTMYIPYLILLTNYDMLAIIVTSRNRNANAHQAELYFQTSNTYSHLHTSFIMYGPTGSMGPTGPSGYTGATGATGPTLWSTIPGSPDIYYNEGNVGIATSTPAYTLDVSGTLHVNFLIQF